MHLPRRPRRDGQHPGRQPALPHPPPPTAASPAGPPAQPPAPPVPARHTVHESVRIVTTPMPDDVAADHEGIPVIASAKAPLADINNDPSYLLTIALEHLGRAASESGCDGLYAVHHTLAVDNGVMYICAMGTGSRPTPNLDGPPQRFYPPRPSRSTP
jgi:hypothetical protein